MELVFQLFSHQKQQIVTTHNRDVKQAIDYINTHYQKKLTLSLIAKHVNLSENYLSRIFKEEVGQSIIHYINTVKMEKAADLILKGNPYIKEISTQIGIHDQFYFTRLFKNTLVLILVNIRITFIPRLVQEIKTIPTLLLECGS